MATWQFTLFVLSPAAPLPQLSGEGWDIAALSIPDASVLESHLRDWLGSPSVLVEPTLTFGEENGNRVDLSCESDGYEIHIRLDARHPSHVFAEALCRLLRSMECVFFAPESMTVVPPEPVALLDALDQSRAAKFCKSPRVFLESLRNAG